jgi:phenylpropionate dioxygenase-like ring-hydroxylating dioxygenase large terminal subunit
MAISDGYAISPQCLTWDYRTRLKKEMKEEARQRVGRLGMIRLKDKLNMVLAKGETPEAGKWNNTDLKVVIQWFKREGDKVMPNNKDGLLICYRETCTRVVSAG